MAKKLKEGDRVKTPGDRSGVIVRFEPAVLPAAEALEETDRDRLPRVAIVLWDRTGKEERALVSELSLVDQPE